MLHEEHLHRYHIIFFEVAVVICDWMPLIFSCCSRMFSTDEDAEFVQSHAVSLTLAFGCSVIDFKVYSTVYEVTLFYIISSMPVFLNVRRCPFCKTSNYAVEYRGVKTKEEKGIEQIVNKTFRLCWFSISGKKNLSQCCFFK